MSRTCLRFKVKSPRRSPTSCRQNFRWRRNPLSKNGPQKILPLTISTCGRAYLTWGGWSNGPNGPYAEASFIEAASLLDQAIARDPEFFLAYCQLARTHDALYFSGKDHTPARLALADAAIAAAARLRPKSGELHLLLAEHFYRGYLDYDRARAELALAQRTLPNNEQIFYWMALIDRRQGRWNESVLNFEKAMELDPRQTMYLRNTAQSMSSSVVLLKRPLSWTACSSRCPKIKLPMSMTSEKCGWSEPPSISHGERTRSLCT